MIRAMVWKEYREHRAVWLTLAVVGGLGLFGLTRLMAPDGLGRSPEVRQSLQAVAVLLAWTYGLVCGAMLLAGERESATLTFLDMLPVRRLELWGLKALVGLALFLAQVAVLAGFLVGLDLAANELQLAATLLAMVFFGLFGMSWGLLFSARGDSVLNVIGLAIAGQVVCTCAGGLLSVPLVFVLHATRLFPTDNTVDLFSGGVVLVALTAAPAVGSARIFSRPDRLRRLRAPLGGRKRPGASPWASWVRVLWLSYSQMRRFMLGLLAFSLGLGLLVPAAGPIAWPVLTLFLGVLCGVTACSDEQAHASFRFLGDQRFPLGRIWVVKVALRFGLAVLASCVLLLPSLVLAVFRHEQAPTGLEPPGSFAQELMHSCLLAAVVPPGLHLAMWLLYGFTAGQLGGLLFRKSLVAAVVSLGAAVTLAGVWLPSLLGMGLHFWQVAGAPLILLATAAPLVPAWAADRLVARRTFLRLGAGLAAGVAWTAGAMWYRVHEVPDLPDRFDMRTFASRIPLPEDNQAGLATRAAWPRAEYAVRALSQRRTARPLFRNARPADDDWRLSVQLAQVLERGWPAGESELGAWLDGEAFAGDWPNQLATAADHPTGVLEDPRKLNVATINVERWRIAPEVGRLLAVRGLQLQSRGDDAAFVRLLRSGLALSRNLQHFAPSRVAVSGQEAERVWLPALDRWMERLDGRPDLLGEVLEVLARHEAELPDPSEAEKTEYLLMLNSLDEVPEKLVEMEVFNHPHEDPRLQRAEIEAATLLWRLPWEHTRHQRILRAVFEGDRTERHRAAAWGGFVLARPPVQLHSHAPPRGLRDLANLRAAWLRVALRLYQAQTGRPAEKLAALEPRHPRGLPTDPFSGASFGYRLSHGERIDWPERAARGPADPPPPAPPWAAGANPAKPPVAAPPPPDELLPPGGAGHPRRPPTGRFVPAGQGILWSAGEDGHDDGGLHQGHNDFGATFGEDILYLVPLPPK